MLQAVVNHWQVVVNRLFDIHLGYFDTVLIGF